MAASNKKFHTDVQIKSDIIIDSATPGVVPVYDANKKIKSSTVTSTEIEYVSGVTSSIQTQLNSNSTAISDHLSDASDAHDASAISNVPSGNLAATDVQAALNELQSDIDTRALQSSLQAHLDDASDAHDASAISNIPAGNLAATDVQAALNELQSDIDTRALDSTVIKKDGSVAFTADQSMGGFKLTGLAAPSSASDAATKGYVDSALEGLRPKEAVRVATTVAGTLASSFENGDTIDGIVLATGNRILIKDQAAPAENGIYIVQASGAPVRSSDFDSVSPIDEINKAYVAVQEGTSNAGKLFVQYGAVSTIGVDAINFTFFNSVSGLVGGDGITVSGSNISVDHDGLGLDFVANQLSLELDGATLSKSASGLKLSDTAVTPGSYGSASETVTFTVDQQGRLTASSEQSISITASQVSDFNEAAQDAVGGALVDSASIDFTYNDGANTITAAVLPAGVDHDSLQNFVANEHIDHSSVQIATAANSGLTGGGDITATRNLSVDINGTTALAATPDSADTFLVYDASATALRKVTYTELLAGVDVGSAGDINETSFSIANNQVAAANITGLAFANGVVRSFSAIVSIAIDATSDLFEEFELNGVQRGADWAMSVESTGDDSLISFSINSSGQVQYTSGNYAGFVSGAMKFRAITTSV